MNMKKYSDIEKNIMSMDFYMNGKIRKKSSKVKKYYNFLIDLLKYQK